MSTAADIARELKITPPRRRALHVLVWAEINGLSACESNETSFPRGQFGASIYWQTAGWLIDTGLATRQDRRLVATQRAFNIASALGLVGRAHRRPGTHPQCPVGEVEQACAATDARPCAAPHDRIRDDAARVADPLEVSEPEIDDMPAQAVGAAGVVHDGVPSERPSGAGGTDENGPSLIADGVPPITAAVRCRTNAELIADHVHPLYRLDDVLDVTYGRGKWWTKHRPARLVAHDIATDGIDFRRLPEPSRSQVCVAFDPPYVPIGGRTTSTIDDFTDRYGLIDAPTTPEKLRALIRDGLTEIGRVLAPKGLALVKCMNYVSGGQHRPQVAWTIRDAEDLGFTVETQFVHIGRPGPQPHRPTAGIRSPRANYSVLVVLRAPGPRSGAMAGQLELTPDQEP